MLKLSEKLLGADRMNVPTKLDKETWKLRDDVVTFARNNCYLFFVVPSLISGKESIPREEKSISPFEDKCPYEVEEYNIKEIQDICNIICVKAEEFLNEGHTLNQTQVTEICIFMLSNSDRIFQRDHPNRAPMAFIMKGPSLSTSDLRRLVKKCRNELKDRSIPILFECYDGQWSRLCTLDEIGFP